MGFGCDDDVCGAGEVLEMGYMYNGHSGGVGMGLVAVRVMGEGGKVV